MKTNHKFGLAARQEIRLRRDFFPEMDEGRILFLAKTVVLEAARNHATSFKQPSFEQDGAYGWGTEAVTDWQSILSEAEN